MATLSNDGNALKNYRRAVSDVFNLHYAMLISVLEGSMRSFASKAFEAGLITFSSMQNSVFSSIFREFKISLEFCRSISEVQERWKTLTDILEDLGGPASIVGRELNKQLSSLTVDIPLETSRHQPNASSHMKVSTEHPVFDQRHFDKALKSGSVKARISKAIVQGPARAGKTSVKCLVLHQRYASNESTSAFESPQIAVNITCHVKLDGEVHWELVDTERMVRKFASEMKSLIAKIVESEEDSSPSPDLLEENIFDDEMELRDLVSKAEQLENKLTLYREWLYFIDCGGQIQFQQLVQAFIPCASVLLLVTDLSEALSNQSSAVFQYAEGKDCTTNVSDYLPSVDTLLRRLTLMVNCDGFQSYLAGDSELSGMIKVPEQLKVVAIGTHGDIYEDLQRREEKVETIQQKEEKLSQIFQPIMFKLSLYNGKILYQVDGRNAKKGVFDDPAIKVISAELRDQAFEVNIPLSWYALEIMLREKASCGILSLETCKKIGAKINLDKAEVQSALKFFHLLNTILYYPGVSDLVFVKPESLIDVIRELVVYIYKKRENVKTDRETQDMIEAAKKGFVTKNVFKNFEKCKKILDFFPNFSQELLNIFQHLLIATKMPEEKAKEMPEVKFFMPAILPLTDPSCATSSYKFSLVYYFDIGVPLGLFCAMIVNLLLLRVDTSDDFVDDSIWSVHQKLKLYSNLITLQHYDMKGKVVFVESNDCFEIHFQYAEDKEKGKKDIRSTLEDTIKKRKFESNNIKCKMASFCPCPKQPRHAAILHACGKLRCTISGDLKEDPDKQSDTTSSKVMTTPSTARLQTSSIDQPLEDTKSPDVDNIVEMTTPSTTMPQMSPKREEYTDVDTQDIPVKEDTSIEDFPKLHERPRKIDVLEQLVCIDTEWRKIGNGLRLDPNFLEGLAQSHEPNQIRLDKVLQKWMDMDGHPPCPPVTWNAVLVVLKGKLLQKHVLAKEIHQYLKPQENLKQQTDDVEMSTPPSTRPPRHSCKRSKQVEVIETKAAEYTKGRDNTDSTVVGDVEMTTPPTARSCKRSKQEEVIDDDVDEVTTPPITPLHKRYKQEEVIGEISNIKQRNLSNSQTIQASEKEHNEGGSTQRMSTVIATDNSRIQQNINIYNDSLGTHLVVIIIGLAIFGCVVYYLKIPYISYIN